MDDNNSVFSQRRRRFFTTVLPACAISCFGFKNLFASEQSENKSQEVSEKHNFKNEFCMSHEDAWIWKYEDYIIGMETLAELLGRDKLIDLLKKGTEKYRKSQETYYPENTLAAFVETFKGSYFENLVTIEFIEETDRVVEFKVKYCLWAKTFCERNAGDIGYATICHGAFSEISVYNPKMKLKRTKTLMQGHDCCVLRYIWEVG